MAILKNAIKALDPAPDKKSELTLLLSLLSEMCEQKVKEFNNAVESELRTAGDGENRTIPVTEIVARHKEYRAYVKDDAGKIAGEVADAVKNFVTGDASAIIDGIASLVTAGIEAIIGAGTATQQEMSSYYIVAQNGAIVRYDIRVWTRQIEAAGITKQIENSMAIVAFKSSVDVSKISYNTFLIAYASQLANMRFPGDKQREYLAYAREIFDQLRREGSNSILHDASHQDAGQQPFGPTFGYFRCPGELVIKG